MVYELSVDTHYLQQAPKGASIIDNPGDKQGFCRCEELKQI